MARGLSSFKEKMYGSVAVEFALIAPIFLWTVAAGLELGLFIYTQFIFEAAKEEVVRESYNLVNFSQSNIPTYLDAISGKKNMIGYTSGGLTKSCTAVAGTSFSDCTLSYPYTFKTPMVADIFGDQTVKAVGRFKFGA